MNPLRNISGGAVATLGIASFLLASSLVGSLFGSGTEPGETALQAKLDQVASQLADVGAAVDNLAAVGRADGQADQQDNSGVLTDTLLIKFKAGVSEQAAANIFKNAGVTVAGEIGPINVKVVRVPERALEQVRTALAKNPRVEFVEENKLVAADFIPDDPEYGNQWHHGVIGSPVAWDTASNTPIVVAVADTGVSPTQPDLSAILLPGYNTVDNTTNSDDIHNHGTWVAGTIAAIGNNATQVAGVAYGAKILPIRISNRTDGYAYFSDMAEAIVYAADHGARIVNLSFGGAAGSATIWNAAAYMHSKGGLTFISAGNDNTDYGYVDSDSVIVVGATTNSDVRSSFSSYGAFVDLAAPGSGIRTTSRSGGTASVNGTSFASPIAASVAALVWGTNPSLSPEAVEQIIKDTAKDLGTAGWDKYYGWGRVDAQAAVALASVTDGPAPDVTAPVVSFGQPQSGAEVEGLVSVVVDAVDTVGVDKVELYVDELLLGTDANSPYQFSLDTTRYENGAHTLRAVAYDTSGNAESAQIAVTVANVPDSEAPVVRVSSPADGSAVSSKKVFGISVSATDNVQVTEIDILFDGVLQATCIDSASCSANVNARKESEGSHTITAVAYDAAGNVAVVDSVVVIGSTTSTEPDPGTDDTTDTSTTKPVKCEPWPSCR